MLISKNKALELIDEKIKQFQYILDTATYDTRYNTEYNEAYYGTENLLKELFSEEEAKEFRLHVSNLVFIATAHKDYEKELKDYKKHINKCISQLKVYKERIQNFWEEPVTSELVTTEPETIEYVIKPKTYEKIIEPETNEHIINWSLLRRKVQLLLSFVKKFWKIILAILGFLVLVGGASDGVQAVLNLLNSTNSF